MSYNPPSEEVSKFLQESKIKKYVMFFEIAAFL